MTNQTTPTGPTRRDTIKYGGAVVGSGLLTGCTGAADSESTPSESDTPEDAAPAADGSYSVTMSPVGTVEFETVPERIFTRLSHHAGMAFALGHGDDITALNGPEYYHDTWNQFTPRLPGVSVDWSDLYPSWQPSKEKLYELDSDIHLADPAYVVQLDEWDTDDLEEIEANIGPWFGNSLSGRRQPPTDEWTGGYEYYTLWEQFEKVAQVFQEEDRYEALSEIHDQVLSRIEADLPPAFERPGVVMITASDVEEQIWAYTVDTPGFLSAHMRPLAPRDAFEGDIESGTTVDFEALLEADPDVILFESGMQPEISMDEIRDTLESHPVASEITAVADDRVHATGARFQGPILNLFQIEMCAKQFYPDIFGEWPHYDTGPYPEIPAGEQLFDCETVADIINGDI